MAAGVTAILEHGVVAAEAAPPSTRSGVARSQRTTFIAPRPSLDLEVLQLDGRRAVEAQDDLVEKHPITVARGVDGPDHDADFGARRADRSAGRQELRVADRPPLRVVENRAARQVHALAASRSRDEAGAARVGEEAH